MGPILGWQKYSYATNRVDYLDGPYTQDICKWSMLRHRLSKVLKELWIFEEW